LIEYRRLRKLKRLSWSQGKFFSRGSFSILRNFWKRVGTGSDSSFLKIWYLYKIILIIISFSIFFWKIILPWTSFAFKENSIANNFQRHEQTFLTFIKGPLYSLQREIKKKNSFQFFQNFFRVVKKDFHQKGVVFVPLDASKFVTCWKEPLWLENSKGKNGKGLMLLNHHKWLKSSV